MTDPNGGQSWVHLPYPHDTDKKIRDTAAYVQYDAVAQILDMIRDDLCGNAARAEGLANDWGLNATMNDAKVDLNDMRNNLASYWRGPAFNAFNLYSANAAGVMDKDLAVMGDVSKTLGTAISTVYDTYASAIKFMGNCVASLSSAGIWAVIAVATIPIPGVDVLTASAAVNKTIEVLTNFIKDVTALVSDATTQIGKYKSEGVSFANQGTQFQHPEPLPSSAGHTGEWQVNPLRSS